MMENMGQGRGKLGLKMKELVEATGLPKSTLLYYASLGLIPEPVKTSPNMAYYNPKCIDRVKFIQNMRQRHRLSLSEIRELIKEWDEETPLSIHIELTELVFGGLKQESLIDLKTFRKATGLTQTQVRRLLEARLLLPLEKNRFNSEDLVMGKVLARGLAWGYRVKDLVFYVHAGEEIVDRELELRKIVTRKLPVVEDAAMTLEMVKSARITRSYIVDRLFQHRVAKMRGLKDEDPHRDA